MPCSYFLLFHFVTDIVILNHLEQSSWIPSHIHNSYQAKILVIQIEYWYILIPSDYIFINIFPFCSIYLIVIGISKFFLFTVKCLLIWMLNKPHLFLCLLLFFFLFTGKNHLTNPFSDFSPVSLKITPKSDRKIPKF